MRILRSAAVFAAAVVGVATSALGGTAGAFTFTPGSPVAPLSPVVSYRSSTLQTFVGLQVGDIVTNVLATNTSGAAANNVNLVVSATVKDPDEQLSLYKPEVYLPSSSSLSCKWDKDLSGNPVSANTVSFTCHVDHMANGAILPAFFVFYTAPTRVKNGIVDDLNADSTPTDFVTTTVQILYAENANDQPGSVPDNSSVIVTQADLVGLGTSNPKNVKSGLSKDGGTLTTGTDAIPFPTDTPTTYQFASKVTVPTLPGGTAPSRAEILLSPDSSPDDCASQGNFKHCYQAQVTVGAPDPVQFSGLLPDSTKPCDDAANNTCMKMILRIDGSEVINPFRAANVQILHDGVALPVCQPGQPDVNTPACVVPGSIKRYSNAASYGDLRQDVEAIVRTLRNGSWGMR